MMGVDRERNCYSCRGSGHLTRNCRNWGIMGQGRRIEYGDNLNTMNNLKKEETSSPQLGSYNKFHILANYIMQASIPDQEKPKKDRKKYFKRRKSKEERKRKERTRRCEKNSRRRIDSSKDWFRKNRYTGEDYSKSITGQWSNRFGNEL